jgi:hypothetical protein
VASHHGVAIVDVAESLRAGEPAEEILRDVVHTTPFGAETVAGMITDELESILDPTVTATGGVGRLFDRSFRGAQLVPATPDRLRDPASGSTGRFRLFYPYVQIEPGGCFECTFDGELVGLVVVVGPESGIVRAGTRELTLFDRWCYYERLSTVVFDPGFEAGAPVAIELTGRPVDRSACDKPVARPDAIRTSLKVVGFMVRPC